MSEPLLIAQDITKYYHVDKGLIFSKAIGILKAVDGVSFTIGKGETFGLVGESGCGKTTTSKLVLMLEQMTKGIILFNGQDITKLAGSNLQHYRRMVQAVFQNPYGSLSPRMRVGDIIAEPLRANNALPKNRIKERVAEVLTVVKLTPDKAELYPHEFSGGQRQRIAIARALALNPGLIILDEPVSALDVSIRAQIINLLMEIQEQFNISYMLIAHDLAVVKHMSHRIGVMYLGTLVETAKSEELHKNPLHPYTHALYSAALPSHPDEKREEIILPGEVSSPLNPPSGCRFHPRCSETKAICGEETPILVDVGGGHHVACHNLPTLDREGITTLSEKVGKK
jgi:oligopeptide/dipeptide ABC transporter ATP-binding protein